MPSKRTKSFDNDVAVICTKNRRDDLYRCLESISRSTEPPRAVAVVDGGSDLNQGDLAQLFEQRMSGVALIYLRSDDYGLVRARNVALNALEDEFRILHFFDDDVILGSTYFELLRGFFRTNRPVGAGGLVNVASPSRPHKLFTTIGIHTNKPGVILPNGFATGSDEVRDTHRVEWLPGCAMSYDLERIGGMRFDERRAYYPIGEDVDFSCRAAARGPLFHVGSAELFHNLSPVNRVGANKWVREDVWHRWAMAEDGLGGVKRGPVITSSILFALLYIAGGALRRNRSHIGMGLSAILGLWEVVSGRGRIAS